MTKRLLTPFSWKVTLVLMLAYRDIRVRYKRAWLGVLWALGVPLMLTLIFTVVYRVFFRAPIEHYPLFVLSALFPWLFFQGAVSNATMSFLGSGELLKRVPLPRAALPLAAVLVEAFHFLVAIGLLLLLAFFWGRPPGWHLLFIVPAFANCLLLAAGTGMLLAPLQIRFRDIKYFVDLGLMAAFYAAPIIYSAEMVPPGYRRLVVLNPFGLLVSPFREILYLGRSPSLSLLLAEAILGLALVAAGLVAVRWGGKNAADHV